MSHVLGEETIAFEEIDNALWQVSFGPIALGRFHEVLLRIEDRMATGCARAVGSAPHCTSEQCYPCPQTLR